VRPNHGPARRKHVETNELAQLTRDAVVQRMVGRELADIYNYTPRPHRDHGLEVVDVIGPGSRSRARSTQKRGKFSGSLGWSAPGEPNCCV
jgi:L-arabinose transport system ATP-binding protein